MKNPWKKLSIIALVLCIFEWSLFLINILLTGCINIFVLVLASGSTIWLLYSYFKFKTYANN